jgi:hypothetical protein
MMPALIRSLVLAVLASLPGAAFAQDSETVERALAGAVDLFERALPDLGSSAFGVDVAAYRDGLTLGRFSSQTWGGPITVEMTTKGDASGACAQFAAFTRVPPANGVVPLVLCPRFFTPDADALRKLTILHEMVHAVAGSDECQAMAFAAKVEQLATGGFTPVAAYWRASGCTGSRYSLPD